MKFLTTNFVQCAVKACSKTGEEFPLKYSVESVSEDLVHQEADFDADFILNLMPKLQWHALVAVARDLGDDSLPEEKPNLELLDEDEKDLFIQNLHRMLVEVSILFFFLMMCMSNADSFFFFFY